MSRRRRVEGDEGWFNNGFCSCCSFSVVVFVVVVFVVVGGDGEVV